MSSETIHVTKKAAAQVLSSLKRGLTDSTRLHQFIAPRVEAFTRNYLRILAQVRHPSAEKLGGTPTGHLARAAQNVTSSATAAAATVTVVSPGIGRALRDITIVPVNSTWLTIATSGVSYGRRASSLSRLLGIRLFRPVKKGAKATGSRLVQGPGREGAKGSNHRSKTFAEADKMQVLAGIYQGQFTIFYALTKRVVQKRDPELLPRMRDIRTEASRATLTYVRQLRLDARGGAA